MLLYNTGSAGWGSGLIRKRGARGASVGIFSES